MVNYDDLTGRMDRELKLLGAPSAESKKDIIIEALSEFMNELDQPRAAIPITLEADVLKYDIPCDISKIEDIRDDSDNSVEFSIDSVTKKIVFKSAAEGDVYTVYGNYNDVRTNLFELIEAIDDDYEFVLWQFIRACAYAWAHHDKADQLYAKAMAAVRKAKQFNNRKLYTRELANRFKDKRGRIIGDSNNRDGVTVGISDHLEQDL